jgi:hypothetical protein
MWVLPGGHERKTWWRNLLDERPVQLRVRGRELGGVGQALCGEARSASWRKGSGCTSGVSRVHPAARRWRPLDGIDPERLHRLATRTVMVRIRVPRNAELASPVGMERGVEPGRGVVVAVRRHPVGAFDGLAWLRTARFPTAAPAAAGQCAGRDALDPFGISPRSSSTPAIGAPLTPWSCLGPCLASSPRDRAHMDLRGLGGKRPARGAVAHLLEPRLRDRGRRSIARCHGHGPGDRLGTGGVQCVAAPGGRHSLGRGSYVPAIGSSGLQRVGVHRRDQHPHTVPSGKLAARAETRPASASVMPTAGR